MCDHRYWKTEIFQQKPSVNLTDQPDLEVENARPSLALRPTLRRAALAINESGQRGRADQPAGVVRY